MSTSETPDFGKNQMPPELASALLSRVTVQRPSPEQVEILDCLREECAESIQRASKITRFGLDSRQPSTGRDNRDTLTEELGHLQAAEDVAVLLGMVDFLGRERYRIKKLFDYAKPGGVLRACSEKTRVEIVAFARHLVGIVNEAEAAQREQAATASQPADTSNCGDPGDEDAGTPGA